MQGFCDAFRRNEDGSWICLEPATIQGPGLRMQASPGEIYSPGTELADFLDIEDSVRAETAAARTRLRARSFAAAP